MFGTIDREFNVFSSRFICCLLGGWNRTDVTLVVPLLRKFYEVAAKSWGQKGTGKLDWLMLHWV